MISQREDTFCNDCEGLVFASDPSDPSARCKTCCGTFHLRCTTQATDTGVSSSWTCSDCFSGLTRCFICKSAEGEKTSCVLYSCKKVFHKECLLSGLWPQAKPVTKSGVEQFKCPAHACHTCHAEHNLSTSTSLVTCIRCPTSYHDEDYCVAAGSVHITPTTIICPKHFVSKKTVHINTSWCFLCTLGGSLICCEICPASYHPECLKIEEPEGSFYCPNCQAGKRPIYGETVWVKYSSFRWWPSKVLHPDETPESVYSLPHELGEFVVEFFGTHEYSWINIGKCYPYEEGDAERSKTLVAGRSKLGESFKLGLLEAEESLRKFENEKYYRQISQRAIVLPTKPEPYITIRTIKPTKDCPLNVDCEDQQVCNCDPKSKNPCGPDSDCINRLVMWECQVDTCPAGNRCMNLSFQRMKHAQVEVALTKTKGWGLFIKEDLKKSDFIIEYVGELITMQEYRKRSANTSKFYFMFMDNNRVIDAGPRGNEARFMNHSCDPNCETQKWVVNGDTRIGIFAKTDIKAGTELTFNYQYEYFGDSKLECLCGAPNCVGFIGGRKNKNGSSAAQSKLKAASQNSGGSKRKLSSANGTNAASKAKSRPPRRRRSRAKDPVSFCLTCYKGEGLVSCDLSSCIRSYHLDCIGLQEKPIPWICPSHNCKVCNIAADRRCRLCPNGFCEEHGDSLVEHNQLGEVCYDHQADIVDAEKFFFAITNSSSSQK